MVCAAPHYYPPDKPQNVSKAVPVERSHLTSLIDTQCRMGWRIVSVFPDAEGNALTAVFVKGR